MIRRLLSALFVAAVVAVPAQAQLQAQVINEVKRSGPRFGVTWMSGSIADTLASRYDIDVSPVVTQFGWQFEKQFATLNGGPIALNEWILLIGGLEQGAFLPSLTWLVGLRTPGGFEAGAGPNVTPAGVGLALSTGYTFTAGALAMPVNMAIVPSRYGVRASILTGFNLFK